MRSPALLLLSLLLSASPGRAETPLVWHHDLASARRSAEAGDRLIFVDLQADWCQWCRVLETEVFPSAPFAKLAAERLVLLRVDTEDGAEGTELQLRFDATSLPTALLLTPRLVLAGQVVGYAETAEYVARVRAELDGWRKLESGIASRFGSEDPDELLALAQELLARRDGDRAAQAFARVLDLGLVPDDALPWILYQRADALRLAERWEGSAQTLEEGMTRARATGDRATAERLALLRYQIARDRGDCRGERSALEQFIAEYPESSFGSLVRQTLRQLDRREDPTCS